MRLTRSVQAALERTAPAKVPANGIVMSNGKTQIITTCPDRDLFCLRPLHWDSVGTNDCDYLFRCFAHMLDSPYGHRAMNIAFELELEWREATVDTFLSFPVRNFCTKRMGARAAILLSFTGMGASSWKFRGFILEPLRCGRPSLPVGLLTPILPDMNTAIPSDDWYKGLLRIPIRRLAALESRACLAGRYLPHELA